ncbi:Uncharacterized protein APZ42_029830 [Daphnia magna]|uniref:Uncharacterized protein n=1 Tax=Daphnia magna TaxID=35525 RepID=A0A164PA21_9CRUS|nr:Uncharacterized protein APZ42_029830 [Daphnia magna]
MEVVCVCVCVCSANLSSGIKMPPSRAVAPQLTVKRAAKQTGSIFVSSQVGESL